MKILLIGEYSNVHWTLAEGLRALGHQVTVVSDGDRWKGYPRDINLQRKSTGWFDTAKYIFDIQRTISSLKGYDIVQLINPVFLDLRAHRILPYYQRLRRQNGRLFLGSFGIDRPWVEEGIKPTTFRYSDFYVDGQRRHNAFTDEMQANWLHGDKATLFEAVAQDCDGIIAGLYENYVCCQARFAHKLHFIPFPINLAAVQPKEPHPDYPGIRFFIGIQRARSEYKGTDIMLRALQILQERHPSQMQVVRAENVPFTTYQNLMNTSDVLLDQLYSYTPAMNALLAMAKGLVLVGGGEEEHYALLGEHELRPIINVQPHLDDVVAQIESRLLSHPDRLQQLSADSLQYIRRHHDHIQVARRYLDVWGA